MNDGRYCKKLGWLDFLLGQKKDMISQSEMTEKKVGFGLSPFGEEQFGLRGPYPVHSGCKLSINVDCHILCLESMSINLICRIVIQFPSIELEQLSSMSVRLIDTKIETYIMCPFPIIVVMVISRKK